MFKYENDKWVLVFKDSVSSNSNLFSITGIVDNQFVRQGSTGYYSFVNSDWTKFLNFGNLIHGDWCTGNSYNNVLFHALEDGLGEFVYYFDGEQIYRQLYYYLPDQMVWTIQYKFGKFYLHLESWDNFETYLEIATFKKTNFKILNKNRNKKNNFYNNNDNIIK